MPRLTGVLGHPTQAVSACFVKSESMTAPDAGSRVTVYEGALTYWANGMISTEISTAGTVPLFSSQCVVFLSSAQPTPGP